MWFTTSLYIFRYSRWFYSRPLASLSPVYKYTSTALIKYLLIWFDNPFNHVEQVGKYISFNWVISLKVARGGYFPGRPFGISGHGRHWCSPLKAVFFVLFPIISNPYAKRHQKILKPLQLFINKKVLWLMDVWLQVLFGKKQGGFIDCGRIFWRWTAPKVQENIFGCGKRDS